nr:hypothetical protein [Tanacetum cinerariifolium]
AAIERLVTQRVNAALEAERAGQVNEGGEGSNANEIGGQDRAPPFEKSEMGFSISDCAERNKVKFAAATLQEFCPDEDVHRMEDELRSLKLRDTNIAAYTQRFHELILLCPEAVPTEKNKGEAYIKGLPENIKGETTSSRPVNMNEVVRMAHTLMEQNSGQGRKGFRGKQKKMGKFTEWK